jgi:hypothetical protein
MEESVTTEPTVGFIMLRHVRDAVTNQYWIKGVSAIRQYYPNNPIVIIDDNSNYDFITENVMNNVTVIRSEYPARGELLPYYYYARNKWFDIAVIIHDSVIINSPLDLKVNNYKLLWEFEHNWDQIEDETKIIDMFRDVELKQFYQNKSLWKGCFGCMSIITHSFMTHINNKYDLSLLLPLVLSRHNRCSFERVIACLLQKEGPKETMLGNIHKYCPWDIRVDQIEQYRHLPVIKYWSGR